MFHIYLNIQQRQSNAFQFQKQSTQNNMIFNKKNPVLIRAQERMLAHVQSLV